MLEYGTGRSWGHTENGVVLQGVAGVDCGRNTKERILHGRLSDRKWSLRKGESVADLSEGGSPRPAHTGNVDLVLGFSRHCNCFWGKGCQGIYEFLASAMYAVCCCGGRCFAVNQLTTGEGGALEGPKMAQTNKRATRLLPRGQQSRLSP